MNRVELFLKVGTTQKNVPTALTVIISGNDTLRMFSFIGKNLIVFLEDEEYEQLNIEVGDLCSEIVKKARGHLGIIDVFNILRYHWKYDNAIGEGHYFYVGENVCYICGEEDHEHPTEIAVAICSKEYFDTKGHLRDEYLDFDIAGLVQEQESIFMPESESTTIEEVREKLIDLGFEESEKFSSFCSTHNPFV